MGAYCPRPAGFSFPLDPVSRWGSIPFPARRRARRRRAHRHCTAHASCQVLRRAIARWARYIAHPSGLNLQTGDLQVVDINQCFQNALCDAARDQVRRKCLRVISKVRIENPTESIEALQPFRDQHAFKGRLHRCARRFTTKLAVRQPPALDIFVAVPKRRVTDAAGSHQCRDVLKRFVYARGCCLREAWRCFPQSDQRNCKRKQLSESRRTHTPPPNTQL